MSFIDSKKDTDTFSLWEFKSQEGLDGAFHSLISAFGSDAIFELDKLILKPPLAAATDAVKLFVLYQSQIDDDAAHVTEQTRSLMGAFKRALEKQKLETGAITDEALLPPESVYLGLEALPPSNS